MPRPMEPPPTRIVVMLPPRSPTQPTHTRSQLRQRHRHWHRRHHPLRKLDALPVRAVPYAQSGAAVDPVRGAAGPGVLPTAAHALEPVLGRLGDVGTVPQMEALQVADGLVDQADVLGVRDGPVRSLGRSDRGAVDAPDADAVGTEGLGGAALALPDLDVLRTGGEVLEEGPDEAELRGQELLVAGVNMRGVYGEGAAGDAEAEADASGTCPPPAPFSPSSSSAHVLFFLRLLMVR